MNISSSSSKTARGIPEPRLYYTAYFKGLKTNAQNWVKALCPFHDDHNPSLSVSLEHGGFRCFACGKSGDLIGFHMELNGMSYREARKDLEVKYGR